MKISLFVAALILATSLAAAPAKRTPPPEQTVQIKLRDLLDAIPRKEAAEIAARLKGIEERLTAIEQKLSSPAPAPVPLGAPR